MDQVRDIDIKYPFAKSIRVVSEFNEVFPYDLPSMTLYRYIYIYFCIDLGPGTHPISILRSRMALAKIERG